MEWTKIRCEHHPMHARLKENFPDIIDSCVKDRFFSEVGEQMIELLETKIALKEANRLLAENEKVLRKKIKLQKNISMKSQNT